MNLTFLDPVYTRQGPFACVYLDTSQDIDDPRRAIALRWRHLEHDLTRQGVDTATTDALAHAVGTDKDVPGPHGQAAFAAQGRLILAEELPNPPVWDTARFSLLPDTMPLAVQHAPDIPYVAAAIHRVPETAPQVPAQEVEVQLQAGRWPASKVAGGDRTLRRVPAEQWQQDAEQVAQELTRLADHGSTEAIVLCGDVWARGVLFHKLPNRLHDQIISMDSHAQSAPRGRALLEKELNDLFQGRMTGHDRAQVEMFLARRARHDGTDEGLMTVLDALRNGQVDALLVNAPVDLPMRLWVGTAPKQIGMSEAELRTYGVSSCWEEPADAALMRAVFGTRAELIVVSRDQVQLVDGVGVLPRYADAET